METSEASRAHDKNVLALGARCPESIQILLRVIVKSPFPMFVVAGPGRRLLYNMAYAPLLGSHHPDALGSPFFEVWPEVEKAIAPLIDQAFAGTASLFEDLPVEIHRPNLERAWFTFSYSPIVESTGEVAGVLCVCTETTDAVLRRNRQNFVISLETSFRETIDANMIIETAQDALGRHLEVSRVGYGSLDSAQRYFTTTRNWTDGSVPHHNGTHDLAAFGEEIFGALKAGLSLAVSDTATDPSAQLGTAPQAFAALQVRSAITVSLIKGGRFVAALYVHHRYPRKWSPDDVALVEDVAERTWSAVERAHAEQALRQLAGRQSFLLALGDQLRHVAGADLIKQRAAAMLGERLGVGRAGYGEIDDAQESVTIERDWTAEEMASLAGETQRLEEFGLAIIAELQAGKVLRLDSVADNPVSAAYADGYDSIGTKSLLIVPLIKEGRLIAIFYLHEPEPRHWSDDEEALAVEVAERTWSAVERARAEQALRDLNATLEHRVRVTLEERALYADIVEATDSPIQMIDREHRFLAINPAAQADYQRVYGVLPEVGQSLNELLAPFPEELASALQVWDRALAGETFDQRSWWGDGKLDRRAYEMRFRPVRDDAGFVSAAYLLGRDITELLLEQERLASAEEQLRQAQKMEAMGQLTGGVAHDFNNLLTPIIGSLDMLQRKGLPGEREQRLVQGAAQAAERAKVLVQRLLAFARRQPLQPRPVDVGELVRGMAQLIASTTGPQIQVSVDVAEALPLAHGDDNQLEMALLNLAVNARDAMSDGGTLRVSAALAHPDAARPADLPAGDYIRLSVADTGAGMDELTLQRAVEPFFSTKGVGKGTGLGLSMVHGLALQLGGALSITSRPGVGTNVELWLPVSREIPALEKPASIDAAPASGGTILLVDDDALVRATSAELLKELGFEVTEAASGQEARAILREGSRPRIVITDHLMPGENGTDFARFVLATYPGMPVLIASGYSNVDSIAPDLPRLTKPFRRDELATALSLLT